MDSFALRAANLLVGNAEEQAGLEVGLGDILLEATGDHLVAAAGAGYDFWVRDRRMPLWMAVVVRRGWTFGLRKTTGGTWGYLTIAGGIHTPAVLGSRATYVRGRMGGLDGRPLREGDLLPLGVPSRALLQLAGRELPQALHPDYQDSVTAEVIAGPQADHFSDSAWQLFLSGAYRVSQTSDRMGYRLEGAAIPHARGADIVSDGMVRGSLQVPASGQPLLMMADGPPTGGYPKIGVVASADLHLLAQCAPGRGHVRFRETTVEAAQARQRALVQRLRQGLAGGAWDDDLAAW
jgi:biotin-dependent carboxylase-like uncharacterized protein